VRSPSDVHSLRDVYDYAPDVPSREPSDVLAFGEQKGPEALSIRLSGKLHIPDEHADPQLAQLDAL